MRTKYAAFLSGTHLSHRGVYVGSGLYRSALGYERWAARKQTEQACGSTAMWNTRGPDCRRRHGYTIVYEEESWHARSETVKNPT